MKTSELTKEKRDEFRALMHDYNGNGGPFIMIDLNDLYPEGEEGDTAASLIRDAVSWQVGSVYRNRINQSVESLAAEFIYEELATELKAKIRAVFDEGFDSDVVDGVVTKKTLAEIVKDAVDKWFCYQPEGSSIYSIGNQKKLIGLKPMVGELVESALAKETKQIIKDVNQEVLAQAKKSISQTVSDQLFSGLNLLPKINGASQV